MLVKHNERNKCLEKIGFECARWGVNTIHVIREIIELTNSIFFFFFEHEISRQTILIYFLNEPSNYCATIVKRNVCVSTLIRNDFLQIF